MPNQEITPWNVEAKCENGEMAVIDYDHLITQFGCTKLNAELLAELERVSGKPLNLMLRRNLAFAHRGLDKIVQSVAKGEKFFLYTGRGPSTKSMHIGHAVPFVFCKYLQEAFNVPLVIQITDDEKFLCKNISLESAVENGFENIKDIIAYGFKPELTYIFSNFESSHSLFYHNILKVSKLINLNEAIKVFGFDLNTNIGMVNFPASQIAAGYAGSFPFFRPRMPCLIPCAVDQDPYFRLARDKAFAMGEEKPSTVYVSMLPDLLGPNRKMSASTPGSTIYLNDTMEAIKKKINSSAFSGGRETLEEHRRLGGNPDVDVPFQYLRYFLEDDEELERLRTGYVEGTVTSGEMKKRCIEVIQGFVGSYQEKRKEVTDEVARKFMDVSRFSMGQF